MRSVACALLCLGALATASPAHAEDTTPTNAPTAPTMTLGQVLEVTLRQKPSLQLAAIDVDIADAAVLAATGIDDWVLGATAQLRRTHLELRDPDTDLTVGVDIDSLGLSTSLSRALSTGGAVGITLSSNRDETPFSLVSSSWEHTLVASLSQPLLRGRGSRVARAQQRRAVIFRDAAELDRQAQATTALRDVIVAYWELAYAKRDLEIRRGSLDLAKERLRITKASIKAGATAPTEALAVEQTIATREEEIVAAEFQVLDRALALRQIAGLEISPGNLALDISAPFSVKPEALDLHQLLGESYATSPELASLAKLEDNQRINVEVSDNGVLPRLDAALFAGLNGNDPKFAAALSNMAQLKGYSIGGSLTFEHTLGNRAAKASDRDARARLLRAKINRADAKRMITAAMARSVARAQASEKRLELSRKAIELAEKNVKAEQTRFDLGRATNFDIAQRQEELKLAQLRYARATVDYLNALVDVDSVAGRLPGKYGISLTNGG